MPRLVVVSRYLKSGNNKKLSNYVKYIATREGAATVKENSGTAPATEKQQELITSMLKDFPDSSLGFSYSEYKSNPIPLPRIIAPMVEQRAHSHVSGISNGISSEISRISLPICSQKA